MKNKKVHLRERKRHTARRVAVASACYSGGGTQSTPPDLGRGTPLDLKWGTPPPGSGMGYPPYLDLGWGTPPTWTWDGVPPLPYLELRWGTPSPPHLELRWGTPPPPQVWTDWKYYLPPSFGWRAVITTAVLVLWLRQLPGYLSGHQPQHWHRSLQSLCDSWNTGGFSADSQI